MSSRFINGARYAVATTLAAAVAASGVSNANPAVVATASPPAEGDIVVLKSGWPELNDIVVRAGTVIAATSFQAAGVNSTDVVRYPAGEGGGTFIKASDFVSLSQVRDVEMSGGDTEFFEFQYVEDAGGRKRKVPVAKSAMDMTIMLDYDPDLPWFDALVELDRAKEQVVLRETLPNGDLIYYYGYLSFNKVPTKKINENMTNVATFSLASDPTRYDAA